MLQPLLSGRRCRINSSARSQDMVFTIPSLISHISSVFTLECGDVILRLRWHSGGVVSGVRFWSSNIRASWFHLLRSYLDLGLCWFPGVVRVFSETSSDVKRMLPAKDWNTRRSGTD